MNQPKFRGFSRRYKIWLFGCGWWEIDYTDDYLKEMNIPQQAALVTDSGTYDCDLKSMGQYIGLKDTNGNEIYVGDIIRFKHEASDEWEISDVMYFGDTEWSYPAFDLNGLHIKKSYFESHVLQTLVESGYYKYEVIGNTYENAELLNKGC